MNALLKKHARKLAIGCLWLAIAGASLSEAASLVASNSSTRGLNQAAVHQAYRDGEFEKVTQAIQAFTTQNPSFSAMDSVFVAKHLAVIYAANPQTREKGKYYMYRMLESDPHAELVDMFVSDDVDAAFEKVRKEFKSQHPDAYSKTPKGSQSDIGTAPVEVSTPSKSERSPIPMPAKSEIRERKSNTVWWWVAGGAVAVGAGIATAMVIQGNETQSGDVHKVKF
jgi:hypothetical protein